MLKRLVHYKKRIIFLNYFISSASNLYQREKLIILLQRRFSLAKKRKKVETFVSKIRENVAKVVVGQDVVVERVLVALLTGGHLLLLGVPGLAKTLLVNTISKAINLQFQRIQFTIDMLPSDIVGSEILDQKKDNFTPIKAPYLPIYYLQMK